MCFLGDVNGLCSKTTIHKILLPAETVHFICFLLNLNMKQNHTDSLARKHLSHTAVSPGSKLLQTVSVKAKYGGQSGQEK